MFYEASWTYAGAVSTGDNIIDIMKSSLGKSNISIKSFTIQADQDFEIRLNDDSTLGSFFQATGNYILNLPAGNESCSVMPKELTFLNGCNIIRFNACYGL